MDSKEEISMEERELVMAIAGELDQHRAAHIIEQIKDKIDLLLPRRLVLDLKELSFTDSSGIAVILRLHRAMKQVDGEMAIINLQPQPRKLLLAAGLSQFVSG